METRKFDDFSELGKYIYELVCEESQVVTAVLLYEDAINLIKWIILYDDVGVGSIRIENEDYHGYDKEFYITLDTDLVLGVIPAYQLHADQTAGDYIPLESDVVLYGADVSSKLVMQNIYGTKYRIIFENEDNTDDKCGDCCGDCSNCPHRETFDTIVGALGQLDYVFNHLGDI